MGLRENRMSNEELAAVSGGAEVEGSFTDISQCPPGTVNMKGEIPDKRGKQSNCPYCGSSNVRSATLFVQTWGEIVQGQTCDDCKSAWT